MDFEKHWKLKLIAHFEFEILHTTYSYEKMCRKKSANSWKYTWTGLPCRQNKNHEFSSADCPKFICQTLSERCRASGLVLGTALVERRQEMGVSTSAAVSEQNWLECTHSRLFLRHSIWEHRIGKPV